jgi:hypothetical protein
LKAIELSLAFIVERRRGREILKRAKKIGSFVKRGKKRSRKRR